MAAAKKASKTKETEETKEVLNIPALELKTITLTIQYNTKAITAEQIANLLNVGGFANGVGEWRPEKGGQFGMFHVE